MQIEVCQVLDKNKGWWERGVGGGGFAVQPVAKATGEGCGMTAQGSLPTTDKAVRHGRPLIPLLLNYQEEKRC